MMEHAEFQAAIQRQHEIKEVALKAAIFRKAAPLHLKEFNQRVVKFKAGQQVVAGALPLPVDLVMHESVPTILSDGTKLYSDIFLPPDFQDLNSEHKRRVPAIIAWSPYGKQNGVFTLDEFPLRAGIPKSSLSGLEKFEGPDPAFWCARDYAVVNVDIRGACTSEGDLLGFGHQEAEDGAEFVTWISEQPWCNGKVALTGNSWLAIAQWKIGSLRPRGLAALAPWEGFCDYYRHHMCAGGIPFPSFNDSVLEKLVSGGRVEDAGKYLSGHELWDGYWDDKMAHPERINVPTYVVGSWTNGIHTPGTFKAWNLLPENIPKWLRVHDSHEWPDYYDDNSCRDLLRFFDYYLQGRTDNGWNSTPKVRISVLHFGLSGRADTINRAELDFPLPQTQYTRYYLTGDQSLSLHPPADSTVHYDASIFKSGKKKITFQYQMPAASETTGYFSAHLIMSSRDDEHDEMDVFVQVEKLSSPAKNRQGTLCMRPQSAVARRLLRFMHDWQIGIGSTGPAFSWGPDGQLRASYALGKCPSRSRVAEPFYTYETKVPLAKGEARVLDIPMRPFGMYWEKGDYFQFTVSGSPVNPFPIPGLEKLETKNRGSHVIHCGGRGEESSYILVPHI